jgi:plasmid stabilization system protein ParE
VPNSIQIHPEVLAEAEAAVDWYLARSERAATRFVTELREAMVVLAAQPSRFPTFAHQTRRVLLHRFPYIVVFRETSTTLQVIAIAHGRRRPGYWRDRIR